MTVKLCMPSRTSRRRSNIWRLRPMLAHSGPTTSRFEHCVSLSGVFRYVKGLTSFLCRRRPAWHSVGGLALPEEGPVRRPAESFCRPGDFALRALHAFAPRVPRHSPPSRSSQLEARQILQLYPASFLPPRRLPHGRNRPLHHPRQYRLRSLLARAPFPLHS